MKEDLNIENICYANHQLLIKIDDLLKDLNDIKNENQRLTDLIEIRDDANIDLVEKIKELEQTNEELQNDLNQARNEVSVLNRQLDKQNNTVNNLSDLVETSHKVIDNIKTENKELKFKLKMLTKVHMNSIYGLTATVYTDTDSIKESEKHDDNN